MEKFIKIDYSIHKVLAVLVPVAVLSFYLWLYLGPLCYLYVTFSDIIHLIKRKSSIVTRNRLLHLVLGILYILCFFVLPILYPSIMRTFTNRDTFMYLFWYGLPLCFFYIHFSLIRRDFLDTQQSAQTAKI